MQAQFAAMFKDVSQEPSSVLILSLVEPSILQQSKTADQERTTTKNLALEKLHRQRILKEKNCFITNRIVFSV